MAICNTNSVGGTFNDLFNNSSNNYVYPALSPCAGTGEDTYLELTDKGIGIISGSDILSNIDFSDTQISVSAYSKETKIISPGEVIYIPGLTKGITKRQQGFTMPYLVSTNESLNPLFFGIDLSINYYKNFKYTYDSISVVADYATNVNIKDALNIALDAKGIKAEVSYDPSVIKFIGTLEGYDFSIENVILSIIDTSDNSQSPFDHLANAETYSLMEDPSYAISSAKYPNGAIKGIVMKGMYPSNSPYCPYDHWLYINHVMDPVIIYEPIEIDGFPYNVQETTFTYYDPSVIFGPFVDNIDVNIKDVSCVETGYTYDPSYGLPTITQDVSNLIIDNSLFTFSTIIDSSIIHSGIEDFRESGNNFILNSNIYGSDLYDNNVGANLSLTIDSFITDSSLTAIDVSGGTIQKSYVRKSLIENSDVVCLYLIEDTSILNSTAENFSASYIDFYDSGISNITLEFSGIFDSSVSDSSIVSSSISGSLLQNSDVSSGLISETYIKDSLLHQSIISDSSILGGNIDSSSLITGSVLENIYTNAYILVTGDPSTPYIYVIDDPTLIIDDASNRVEIQTSTLLDASLNNVLISDSLIYTSYIQDASLIGCSLYNVTVDASTVYISPDCSIFNINMTTDCSITWDTDSSTYYQRYSKKLDVGMNGSSTETVMSAGDYLEWITDNNYWNKFGEMYIWTAADDGCATCKNLIDGFYVFNPHTFNVKIEYMLMI
jgi:hypothetical protein